VPPSAQPPIQLSRRRLLNRSGKSAILLHFCHKLARQGKRVLLLCQRGSLESQPPVLPLGVHRSDPAFRSIDIK
jgi:hypothetical protein